MRTDLIQKPEYRSSQQKIKVQGKKRGRPRKKGNRAVSKVQQREPTLKDVSSSLRMECLRLAEFIKQGSYRKASVL